MKIDEFQNIYVSKKTRRCDFQFRFSRIFSKGARIRFHLYDNCHELVGVKFCTVSKDTDKIYFDITDLLKDLEQGNYTYNIFYRYEEEGDCLVRSNLILRRYSK